MLLADSGGPANGPGRTETSTGCPVLRDDPAACGQRPINKTDQARPGSSAITFLARLTASEQFALAAKGQSARARTAFTSRHDLTLTTARLAHV